MHEDGRRQWERPAVESEQATAQEEEADPQATEEPAPQLAAA